MKRAWVLTGLLLVFACHQGWSQIDQEAVRLTHYVFPAFTAGKVLLKNGAVSQQLLNYNVLTNEMIFDAGAGKYLAIAEPASVDTIFIADRTFIPAKLGFVEIISKAAMPLAIVYEGRIAEQGEDIGYGISSQAGASQALRTMLQNGSAYGMKLPDGFQVTLLQQYAIAKNGDWEKFTSFAALARLVPAKKQLINETVKAKKLDVNSKKDLLALFRLINE